MTARLPAAIVWVDPLGRVTTTTVSDAGLGPLLVTTIVTVMVWPTVTDGGTLNAIATSESNIKLTAALAVLLAKVDSVVEVVTKPLKFCTVVLVMGTEYITVKT